MIYNLLWLKKDEKEIVDDQYGNNENFKNDYFNLNDFTTPNHFIGRKNNNEVLR